MNRSVSTRRRPRSTENWNENPRPYVWTKPAEQILESISRYCRRINQTGH
jgi:hypothetical protein